LSKWFILGLATLFTLLGSRCLGLDLQTEIEKEKALLAQSAQKERDILQELEVLAQKIEAKRQEIERLQEEIARKELALRALKQAIANTDNQLKQLQAVFEKRLLALATTGRLGWLNLLFTPSDISTTLRRTAYFQILLAHDQNLARSLRQKRKSLLRQKSLLKTEKTKLALLKRQKEQEIKSLKALRAQKETLLAEVRQNITLYRETLENMVKAYTTIQKLSQELQSTQQRLETTTSTLEKLKKEKTWAPLYQAKGFILPPVQGVVKRLFGFFIDPVTNQKIFQPGIFIAAPAGTPVRAPYVGEVVKISIIKGQGLTLFLNHGYDFLSVIGGLGKVEVSPGDIVKAGEILGEVGEIPFGEAGVYYELRFRNTAQNPLDWLDTAKLHFLR